MIHSDRRLLLAARRVRLVQRAAAQREELARAVLPLAQAGLWLERGIVAGQWLRRRPWLIAAPLALWLWWRPRGAWRALATASALWRLVR